jgi:hypothetical protein
MLINFQVAEFSVPCPGARPGFKYLRRPARIFVLLLLFATAIAGCGSSRSTSPAEAHAIAVAESHFLAQSRLAEEAATDRCSTKDGRAGKECHAAVAGPRQGNAMLEFSKSIEAFLNGGVGPECAHVLDETLSTMTSVSAFPGEATATCHAESQQ